MTPSGPAIDIVYAVEGDYIEGIGASMNSVIKNTKTPERLRFRILTRDEYLNHLAEWLITELNRANQGAVQLYSVTKLFEPPKETKDASTTTTSTSTGASKRKVPRIPLDIKRFNDEDVRGKYVIHKERDGWARYVGPDLKPSWI